MNLKFLDESVAQLVIHNNCRIREKKQSIDSKNNQSRDGFIEELEIYFLRPSPVHEGAQLDEFF
eukprot:gene23519-31870_t